MSNYLNYEEVSKELGVGHSQIVLAILRDSGFASRNVKTDREMDKGVLRARRFIRREGVPRLKELISNH